MFPRDRVLKKQYRELIDRAVFHGATVGLEEDAQHAKKLKLTHGTSLLPFMTWTAGQREFTPLLLGLYHLLPPRKKLKQPNIDWVVIEEPEMGLHPQAITVFMLLCLDLLWRGYRVVLSTHSPLVLSVVWMLRRLRDCNARWQLVCEGFGIEKAGQAALKKVAEAALRKQYKTHLLAFDTGDKLVSSKDISTLDPGDADDDVAGWGGCPVSALSSRTRSGEASTSNEEHADYLLNPGNTKVAFTGQKVGGNHNGSFGKFTGNLHFNPGTLEQSKVDLEIDTSSLHTDSAKLDAHLKSGDFFDVEKFPKARFKSVSLKPSEAKGATHTLTGTMEIKGIKKQMSFPVKITVDDNAVIAKADFVISRKAFKIDFDGAADYLIKDDVPISLSINVPRKK